MEFPKIELSETNKKVIIGVGILIVVFILLFLLRGGGEVPPSALIETEEVLPTVMAEEETTTETRPEEREESLVRDPLLTPIKVGPVEELTKTEGELIGSPYLVWQGVLLGPNEVRTAILNGSICREGDIVQGVKIVSIQKEFMTVEYDGSSYNLRLGIPVGGEEGQLEE